MKPEEHYQRGLELLAQAELHRHGNRDEPARTDAVIAQSHFGAAAAGAAMQAWATTQPPQLIQPGDVSDGETDG